MGIVLVSYPPRRETFWNRASGISLLGGVGDTPQGSGNFNYETEVLFIVFATKGEKRE